MTSYNKYDYVGKSIESILNQTFEDFELILMDDNSDDRTQKVIESYLQDDRIKYYRSDVTTIEERTRITRYAHLINKGIEMASGEYITYITDDNVHKPTRLEKMVNYLDQHPDANICYSASKVFFLDHDGGVIKEMTRAAKIVQWLAPCIIDHCSVMHRADILKIIKKYFSSYWDEDPHYYLRGDARFFWRLNHFWPFYPIDEVLDVNYITKKSLHTSVLEDKESSFATLLPQQKTCKGLRDHLKKLGRGR